MKTIKNIFINLYILKNTYKRNILYYLYHKSAANEIIHNDAIWKTPKLSIFKVLILLGKNCVELRSQYDLYERKLKFAKLYNRIRKFSCYSFTRLSLNEVRVSNLFKYNSATNILTPLVALSEFQESVIVPNEFSARFISLFNTYFNEQDIRAKAANATRERQRKFNQEAKDFYRRASERAGFTKNEQPKKNTQHPKWSLYVTICNTIKSRKNQLDKISESHSDWESLKNEHNLAVRTARKLKTKYNF